MMALIKRFEDILAWQEARKLVKDIYLISRDGNFSKDFGLRDQIQRAAVSVMQILPKVSIAILISSLRAS
jgi:hypothetical protein